MSGLDGEISDLDSWHGLKNALVVGVYLRLLADGRQQTARAWIDCDASWSSGEAPLAERGAYSKTRRPVEVLAIRPMSASAAGALRDSLSYLRDVVWEFAGAVDGSDALRSSPVWVELREPVQPSADDRRRDLLEALEESGAEDDESADFRDLLGSATLGWSHAGGQRVHHFAVPDLPAGGSARAATLIESAQRRLHVHRRTPKSGGFNNWSFASNAPGPALVEQAAESVRRSEGKWQVGVILPGWNKAKSDVEDLYKSPGVTVHEVRVPRGAPDLPIKMAEAVTLLGARNDALVIAYGGGDSEVLARLRSAIRAPLESVQIPTWVAVGHADDRFEISNALVRVCRTPSDARALFLAETVEYHRSVATALAKWSHGAATRLPAIATQQLVHELADVNDALKARVEQHCQR